jgi:hypothetical protein
VLIAHSATLNKGKEGHMSEEYVDADVVQEEETPVVMPDPEEYKEQKTPSQELIPSEHHTGVTNLFRTDDPLEVVQRATAVADALKQVLDHQGLTSNISGKKYVEVTGWQTVGTMLGVVPVVEWTRPVDGPSHQKGAHGWDARVEARTLDGRVVGGAEARCSRAERTWANREDYALKSMAQTRATSKALRGVLGFVVSLAGFNTTPMEEMPQPDPIVDGGKYGPHIDSSTAERLGRAIGFLMDNNAKNAADVWKAIEKDAGYMPMIAARALLHAARTKRDAGTEGEEINPPVPEEGPTYE